jgi:superfamily II DNA/RNA helicase
MELETETEFDKLYIKLFRASLENQLFGQSLEKQHIELNSSEVRELLGQASIFSNSSSKQELKKAYEIVTRLIETSNNYSNPILAAADVILSRIGNFPGRRLLRNRYLSNLEPNISPWLRLEIIAREVENSIDSNDDEVTELTDFQYNLYKSLEDQKSLSVSAPTSAGKSHVLNMDLIRKLKRSTGQCVVYLVPTRALITEVSLRIRQTLKKVNLEGILVRTAPFPVSLEKIGAGIVYILTQERLLSLVNAEASELSITSLIVDEAHEIQKGKRGIILQNAIDSVLVKFPDCSVLFASPLIKNPAYFLNLFGRNKSGSYFVEELSPVSQNILLLSEVVSEPKQIKVEQLLEGKIVNIGIREIDFKMRGSKIKQCANIAFSISNDTDSVIVFADGPAQAENTAKHISKLIVESTIDDELKEFIKFIKSEIHEEYPLIECLEKGVGFHYGYMPSIVRQGVENLFKGGSLRFICCTSTLLQGVNLPAKHIVIENPHNGDSPMKRADFLNLAGRAGRLLKEFHGNIWCVRPSTWDEKSYEGESLSYISSAMSEIMIDGGKAIQTLLNNEFTDDKNKDVVEAAFAKLYHDCVTLEPSVVANIYENEENSDALRGTLELCSKTEITVPSKILDSHRSLRPDHIQKLFDYLSITDELNRYVPLNPRLAGAKVIIESILSVIESCFDWNIDHKYKNLLSFTAYNWVWGASISELLANRIKYARRNNANPKISPIFRNTLKTIETDIRFNMVKYFAVYSDVIKHVLSLRDKSGKETNVEPLHIYFEFGSCEKIPLNLMSLGLSRFTSLRLGKVIDTLVDDDDEPETYLFKLSKLDIGTLNMPALCKQEITELLRYQ